jgi:hypothetical protein
MCKERKEEASISGVVHFLESLCDKKQNEKTPDGVLLLDLFFLILRDFQYIYFPNQF